MINRSAYARDTRHLTHAEEAMMCYVAERTIYTYRQVLEVAKLGCARNIDRDTLIDLVAQCGPELAYSALAKDDQPAS